MDAKEAVAAAAVAAVESEMKDKEGTEKVVPKTCEFEGCGKKVIARGLCVSHYRQALRNKPLKPLRKFRGLVRLPMVIRVEPKTLEMLQKRISEKKATSMYDATRQAVEVGVLVLEALDQEKAASKKGGGG